ncbi:MAG: IctB family putative bicarbonate transporter [Pseudanabaenaceae cyanobacterium]
MFTTLFSKWRSSSRLCSDRLLGILTVSLVWLLPFLENAQIGVVSIALICLLLLLILSGAPLPRHPIFLPLGIYWLVGILATVFSPVRMAAIDGLIKLTLYLGIFLVFYHLLRLGWRNFLVGSYLSSALVVCGYGIHQWLLGAQELATWTDPNSDLAGITRVYSFLGNPNLLAGYLIPVVPLSVVAVLVWRSWVHKFLAGLVGISGILCIFQTYSRGALVGLVGMGLTLVLLLIFWWGRKLPPWTLLLFCLGSLGTVGTAMLGMPMVRRRIETIFWGGIDSSNAFRLNVWRAVFQMIRDRPLLGIGLGNRAFNQVYPLYQSSGFSALGTYSVPLEITVETGIIGLLVYLWLLFTVVKTGWQALLQCRQATDPQGLWLIACFSGIAGMLGHGLFDTVWFRPQVQIIWWLCLGITCSFMGISEEKYVG